MALPLHLRIPTVAALAVGVVGCNDERVEQRPDFSGGATDAGSSVDAPSLDDVTADAPSLDIVRRPEVSEDTTPEPDSGRPDSGQPDTMPPRDTSPPGDLPEEVLEAIARFCDAIDACGNPQPRCEQEYRREMQRLLDEANNGDSPECVDALAATFSCYSDSLEQDCSSLDRYDDDYPCYETQFVLFQECDFGYGYGYGGGYDG